MRRSAFIEELRTAQRPFDVAVIGGGANGAGIALDAASRGLSVVLFERSDFGCGTSSRSSKLIHGGIRYLALGQWSLVREALRERQRLLANAPAIVKPLRFVLPASGCLERAKYACGLKLYDAFGGKSGMAGSAVLNQARLRALAPELSVHGNSGGVAYTDAQFDDARLLIALLRAAVARGALVLNYFTAVDFMRTERDQLCGVVVKDERTNNVMEVAARSVVNATGAWGDRLRFRDDRFAPSKLTLSQGAHVVVDRQFGNSQHGLVLPRTPDGRIMFALPWHDHILLGTTDTALGDITDTPLPLASEIDMILDVASRYLAHAPRRSDVVSVFAGIRPLAAPRTTQAISRVSREHAIDISRSGLVTVSGGKWTSYRLVAEQAVDTLVSHAQLNAAPSTTAILALDRDDEPGIATLIAQQPALAARLHPDLPYCSADYVWAARAEMALTVGDALAYRTRALFIDARASMAIAPAVARLMATELNADEAWIRAQITEVENLAQRFMADSFQGTSKN